MDKPSGASATENAQERYKIVCVDDVQCSLVALKKKLVGRYEVFTAESAAVLFKILEKVKPDLILLDVNMPDIDGYEVIQCLRDDKRYADIPVVFLTSNKDKDSVFKGINLGAVDYIIKPFDTSKLIECIEKQVNISRLEQTIQDDEEKPRILAVDDVVSVLNAIRVALHSKYRVHTISKPETVINFLQLKKPELILLDYLMPKLNGFELIPLIRALPDYQNIPIIMLTSEGTSAQIKEAMALGVSDFMVKPFREDELREKVAKYIA